MKRSAWRRLLLPLVPLYAGLVGVKRYLFDHGLFRQLRLPHGVISVGSLSAGGAGKTPVVLTLGSLLQQRGFELRILTRGYRRNSIEIERVDPAGHASRFGDEPLLLAKTLAQASVFAGADRYRTGLLAERDSPGTAKTIYLLDDGFQHRKLARDVDVVLLTRQELHDRLLPSGNLREPLAVLQRADVIVVRENEPDVTEWVAARIPHKRTWIVQRKLKFPSGQALPRHPIIFSGLARPDGFTSMLAAAGVSPAAIVTFQDHHPYSEGDIETLLKAAQQNKADGFFTTEKDAVKLSAAMIASLESAGPIIVPELQVEIVDEPAKIDELVSLLAERRG